MHSHSILLVLISYLHILLKITLSPHLYCFCAKHSTELAALNIIVNLLYKLDSGLIPINIYLDLSKAFDTLHHDILLDKMNYYGVNGVANGLLRSYLTQRQQIVEFDGLLSKSLKIKTGVPQGWVLGPFLFLIYTNNLPVNTNLFKTNMYADDTTLFCDINNIQDLTNYIEWRNT